MADISAQDVAALRKATGAGMMDCKQALESSAGDLDAAIKEYETLPKLVETFGTAFNGDGKYFIYISDLPGNIFSIHSFGFFRATKTEMITRVLLPAAIPGIVSSFILAFSRAVGETMIVIVRWVLTQRPLSR